MTTAERISDLLDDDGYCLRADDGRSLETIAVEHGARVESSYDVTRFTFADGSVLTQMGDSWDFGYRGCYCWVGVGHADTCYNFHSSEDIVFP